MVPRWQSALRALVLCAWSLGLSLPSSAEEGADEPLGRLLVLMAAEDQDTRVTTTEFIEGRFGEGVEVQWLLAPALADTWREPRLEITGAPFDLCKGDLVGPRWAAETGDLALHLVNGHETTGAVNKALEVESRWACIDGAVTPASLQRTALIRAWAAMLEGDTRGFEAGLRQAAAIDADVPDSVVDLLPAELWQRLAEVRTRSEQLPAWELDLDTEGLPVEAFLDGVALAWERGGDGHRRSGADVAPGKHLLQIVRPGPRAESAVFHLGPEGGQVHVRVVTPVPETESLDVFARALEAAAVPPLLQDLLAAHGTSQHHDHLLLAHTVRAFGVQRLVLAPLLRTAPGVYQVDDSLDRALAHRIDQEAQGVALVEEEEAPLGRWRLQVGGGVGVARMSGYTYGVPCAEIGLETPHWIGARIRVGLSFTREEQTFIQGGVAGLITFAPRIKRLRIVVGVGGEARGPDHRLEGPGIHPIVHGGVGVGLSDALFLTASADVTLLEDHDVGARLTLTWELPLGKKRTPRFEVLAGNYP